MVTYGSGLSRDHDHDNLPTVLTGGGNGLFKLGRHVKHPADTPLANLHVAMMDQMGVPAEIVRRQHRQARISRGSVED